MDEETYFCNNCNSMCTIFTIGDMLSNELHCSVCESLINLNVYGYTRVFEDSEDSHKMQEEFIEDFCNSTELKLYTVVSEYNCGYKNISYNIYDLINVIENNSKIIVYSCSKFCRNTVNFSNYIDKLNEKNCSVLSIKDGIDSRKNRSDFFDKVLLAQLEYEEYYDRKVQEVFRNECMFGYKFIDESTVAEVPKEQRVISDIRTMRQNSKKPYHLFKLEIARKYPEYNWTVSLISRILNNDIHNRFTIIKDTFTTDLLENLPDVRRKIMKLDT